MEYIEIGLITNTHGIRGELKVKSFSNLERFKKNSVIYIKIGNEYFKEKIHSSYKKSDCEIVKLSDYEDINLVLKYKGCFAYIAKEQQLPLKEGFYYHELVGKKIINQNNEIKGVVLEVRDYAHCDMLIIENLVGKSKMIPFIDEFILEVNENIVIKEIDGLL